MQIKIPLGTEINRTENNNIRIKIPSTNFWVLGEKQSEGFWNTYLIESGTDYKELIKENYSTANFARFSNIILKTPFPYKGKQAQEAKIIKKFIKQITQKRKYEPKHTRNKSSSLQVNSTRFTQNESNLTKINTNLKPRRTNQIN